MAAPDFITIAEQVAAYLRGELLRLSLIHI